MPAAALAPPNPASAPKPLAATEPVALPAAEALGALLQQAGQAGELLQQVSIARLLQKTRQLARDAAAEVEGVTSAFLLWDAPARRAVITMTGTSREGEVYRNVARALAGLQKQLRADALVVEGGYLPDELPGEDALIVFRR